jgi:hypothetical protein
MTRLLLFVLGIATAFAEPHIFYSKSFPGSVPAYVEITLERNGTVEYKESPDDDQPIRFRLAGVDADTIFDLAAKLGHFDRPLEAGLNVAKMGEKTYRWIEDGATKHEVKYNYSMEADARPFQDWFEKITETAQHRMILERTVRFDKLGVNKAILQMHAALDRGRIVAPDQFLPLLDRVHKNASYLNMARERAAHIADVIRNSAGTAANAAAPSNAQPE